jgi:ketosteroid isomerase-like protein
MYTTHAQRRGEDTMWKLIRTFLLLLIVGIAVGACAGVQQETAGALASPATVQDQIEEARKQFADAYQRGDAVALSELFALDAAFTGTISPVWREGREAIRDNWARVFREFPKSEISFSDPVVRFYNISPKGTIMDNTIAIETGLFEMRMVNTAGQLRQTPGKYSAIRMWRNGRWEIVNYQTAPIPGQRQ